MEDPLGDPRPVPPLDTVAISNPADDAHADEDLCRVCRSEGTTEDPLFYPCKCSGSIRYVHQACLVEWLDHSKKKHCELCKTPYRFTKVYDADMPKGLPLRHLTRRLLTDSYSAFAFFLRCCLVIFVWLGWLPYCTRHIWNSSLRVGKSLTALYGVLGPAFPPSTSKSLLNATIAAAGGNSTTAAVQDTFVPAPLNNLTRSAHANKIFAEIFEGQVITSIIIVVFVIVFLIREWIVQNNAEMLAERAPFVRPARPAPAPAPAPEVPAAVAAPAPPHVVAPAVPEAAVPRAPLPPALAAPGHLESPVETLARLRRIETAMQSSTEMHRQILLDYRRLSASRREAKELVAALKALLAQVPADQLFTAIQDVQADLGPAGETVFALPPDTAQENVHERTTQVVKDVSEQVKQMRQARRTLREQLLLLKDQLEQLRDEARTIGATFVARPGPARPVDPVAAVPEDASGSSDGQASQASARSPHRQTAFYQLADEPALSDSDNEPSGTDSPPDTFTALTQAADAQPAPILPEGTTAVDPYTTAAEDRALRRKAILAAATKRLEQTEHRSELRDVLDTASGSLQQPTDAATPSTQDAAAANTPDEPRMTRSAGRLQALQRKLAEESGTATVEEARQRAARERSAERKAWDARRAAASEIQAAFEEQYPDSPMPVAPLQEADEATSAIDPLQLESESQHQSADSSLEELYDLAHYTSHERSILDYFGISPYEWCTAGHVASLDHIHDMASDLTASFTAHYHQVDFHLMKCAVVAKLDEMQLGPGQPIFGELDRRHAIFLQQLVSLCDACWQSGGIKQVDRMTEHLTFSLWQIRAPDNAQTLESVDHILHVVDHILDVLKVVLANDADKPHQYEFASLGSDHRMFGFQPNVRHKYWVLLPAFVGPQDDESELPGHQESEPEAELEHGEHQHEHELEHGPEPAQHLAVEQHQQVQAEFFNQQDAGQEFEDEMEDALGDDDIDGLLELVGARGSVVALLQNSILVVVLISTFIFFGICVPLVLGRASLQVLSEPKRYLIDWPRGLAQMTYTETIVACRVMLRGARYLCSPLLPYSASLRVVGRLYDRLYELVLWLVAAARPFILHGFQQAALWFNTLSRFIGLGQQKVQPLLGSDQVQRIYLRVCQSFSGSVMAIFVGYLDLTFVSVLYLQANIRLSSSEEGRQIEVAIRAILRQAGYVVKFVAILSIELAVFPLYCGVLLDWILMPLIRPVTLTDRFQWLSGYPFTSLFLHWLVGTIYMFHFALFISMCRRVVRPGLLFFVRDPDDPEFNPIKDILERPIRSQMRKIGLSVFIYGTLILAGIGSIVWAVQQWLPTLLPLQWTAKRIFEIPIDTLACQMFIPVVYKYFRLGKRFRLMWGEWFRVSAGALRLTSFIMGHRVIEEEGRVKKGDAYTVTGSFRRLPQSDTVPMRKDHQPMIMRVTEDNVLLDKVDGQMDDTREDPNYTVVYVPPLFRLRLYLFLLAAWAFGATGGLAGCTVPLVLGRRIAFSMTHDSQTNDIANWLVGVAALLASVSILQFVWHLATEFRRVKEVLSEPLSILHAAKKVMLFAVSWVYLLTMLGVLVPIVFALCIKAYIISPLAYWSQPDHIPVVNILQDWLLGLVFLAITIRSMPYLPNTDIYMNLRIAMTHFLNTDRRYPKVGQINRLLIRPILIRLFLILVTPAALGFVALKTRYRHVGVEMSAYVIRLSYPSAALAAAVVLSTKLGHIIWRTYRQRIRDEIYLKGSLLHNYGAKQPPRAVLEHADGLTIIPGQAIE